MGLSENKNLPRNKASDNMWKYGEMPVETTGFGYDKAIWNIMEDGGLRNYTTNEKFHLPKRTEHSKVESPDSWIVPIV